MTRVWVGFMVLLLLYAGYRERSTFPLRWSGYAVNIHPLAKVLAFAGIVICLALWARQRG